METIKGKLESIARLHNSITLDYQLKIEKLENQLYHVRTAGGLWLCPKCGNYSGRGYTCNSCGADKPGEGPNGYSV